MKKATGAINQVIIYSKHWYKSSEEGVIEDVRKLLAKYSKTDLEYISPKDAKEVIIYAFSDYVTKHDLREGILDVLKVKWEGWSDVLQRDPYDIMIGKLSIIEGKYVDIEKKMDFCLDPEVIV